MFLAATVLFLPAATAQNEGQYTHYMFNRLSYNPGFAGSSGNFSATVLYRNQWMGLKLAAPTSDGKTGSTPTDILSSVDLPVRFLHGGLGLNVNSQSIGYHQNIAINIDYAFRIFWGPGTLAAGFEVDLYNMQFNTDQLYGIDQLSGDYYNPVSGSVDPVISAQDNSDFLFDLSTGLYYQVPGVYYIGLSAKNLLGSKSDALSFKNARTFYLMGGYDYAFPYNPSFTLRPSFLAKTADFAVFQAEAAVLLDYENTFWAGLGYRLGDAFTFLGGVNVKWSDSWLRFGLAYDLTTNHLGTFKAGRTFGSLEAFLNFSFQIEIPKRPPTISRTTRYLLY